MPFSIARLIAINGVSPLLIFLPVLSSLTTQSPVVSCLEIEYIYIPNTCVNVDNFGI